MSETLNVGFESKETFIQYIRDHQPKEIWLSDYSSKHPYYNGLDYSYNTSKELIITGFKGVNKLGVCTPEILGEDFQAGLCVKVHPTEFPMTDEKENYFHVKTEIFPIYRGRLNVVLTNDLDRFEDFVQDEVNALYGSAYRHVVDGYMNYTIALNFDNPHSIMSIGCLAHEATHCAMFLLEDRGVEIPYSNPEPLTYLIEYITDFATEFIREKGFKFKHDE